MQRELLYDLKKYIKLNLEEKIRQIMGYRNKVSQILIEKRSHLLDEVYGKNR